MVTESERAAFEAGIKLGALYHQFTGTPVGLDTAESLEQAIKSSISLQPYVRDVRVRIDRNIISESLNRFGYCELNGRMLDVSLEVEFEKTRVCAALKYDGNYPMMRIEEVHGI
ncbi:MAG TPA: hypothetical protein HA257_00730 [Candidatus Methanoperedenaceae archaeon]|nr:hypothetical protein [Candidatus Methanoperedenaceae archaeon]